MLTVYKDMSVSISVQVLMTWFAWRISIKIKLDLLTLLVMVDTADWVFFLTSLSACYSRMCQASAISHVNQEQNLLAH